MGLELLWGVIVVLGLGWGILAYEWWGLPRRRARVLLTFVDDGMAPIEGVLWQRRGRWLILRDAALLEVARPVTAIDGEVVIDRAKILFMQVGVPRAARPRPGHGHG